MTDAQRHTDEQQIRQVLQSWAGATRSGKRSEILKHHHPDALIFDVLAPMRYLGTEAYRASWDSWQPDTEGEIVFELIDVHVAAGGEAGFASCLIRCGGTLKSGKTFEDLVRATLCLQKLEGKWTVMHQHISKPMEK